eukprot:gnl/MRDRNA2_/MRDRNA2_15470_c0_seq1.p1 gnl/MRDRNA2_/MRDRNA2_15470_c0~~gnl/MRDRNA2_/MRDRNA2_15470_c0_seq1.p1  ORF type:complete len:207 (+),score=21.61 gnl/MRDRNA2_/MRDRNA2_15470_c0_seq1:185-805(+)
MGVIICLVYLLTATRKCQGNGNQFAIVRIGDTIGIAHDITIEGPRVLLNRIIDIAKHVVELRDPSSFHPNWFESENKIKFNHLTCNTCKNPPYVHNILNWMDVSGWELVTMSSYGRTESAGSEEERSVLGEVYVFREVKHPLQGEMQGQSQNLSAMVWQSAGQHFEYLSAVLVSTLASWMLLFISLRKCHRFQNHMIWCHEYLMHT